MLRTVPNPCLLTCLPVWAKGAARPLKNERVPHVSKLVVNLSCSYSNSFFSKKIVGTGFLIVFFNLEYKKDKTNCYLPFHSRKSDGEIARDLKYAQL